MFKNLKAKLLTKKDNFKTFIIKITQDLKELPLKAKIALFCLGLFMLWNTFFDFNHFLHPDEFPSFWTIVNSKKFQPWQQVLLTLNGLAGFTNIIAVILIAFGKITNYFWGFFGISIYGIFALAWDYVDDMQLNLFYFLPFQFIGYNLWKRHFTEQKILVAQRLNLKTTLFSIFITLILIIIFYFELFWSTSIFSSNSRKLYFWWHHF